MIVSMEFDGVLVDRQKDPCDPSEPLRIKNGAREGLAALMAAGHVLVLSSCRANLALREDWRLNPLWNEGALPFDPDRWVRERPRWEAAYRRMVAFVDEAFPGAFDAVDDGRQGKILSDVHLDDRAMRAWGLDPWRIVVETYGDDPEKEGARR